MLIPHYHIYRKIRICPIARSHPPIETVQLGVSLLMKQYNTPHPGAFIQRVYLEPNYLSCSELAQRLQVSDILLKQLINGYLDVSPGFYLWHSDRK